MIPYPTLHLSLTFPDIKKVFDCNTMEMYFITTAKYINQMQTAFVCYS